MDDAPILRFSQFNDKWDTSTLGQLSSNVQYGLNRSAQNYDGMNAYIRITDIDRNNLFKPKPITSPEGKLSNQYKVKQGDILFVRTGATTGKSYLYNINDGNLFFAGFLIRFHISEAIPSFIFLQTLRNDYHKWVKVMSVRSGQPGINAEELRNLPIKLPKIKEQQKIADFLSSVNNKIHLLTEKQNLLKDYKKGVLSKLFLQKLRFKDDQGNNFPDWVEDRIDNFVKRTSESVEVEANTDYQQIGVKSHGKGIFHKESVKGKELGNKRVFWVHKRAFVVNIVFAWEHAVALTSEKEKGFIASHRFPMFVPQNDRVDLGFFLLFFLSKRGKYLLGLASPGGAGRNKTLGQNNFLELKVSFPCLKEQQKIVSFINEIDNKIDSVTQQIEQTKTFKKGLLQKMFV